MSRTVRGLGCLLVTLAFVVVVGGDVGASGEQGSDSGATNGRGLARVIRVARKKTRAKKGTAKKADAEPTPETAPAPTPTGGDSGDLKFSKDIAPILVANCTGCHNERQKRGKFDLTTFQKLMAGTSTGEKVIVPGKPDESHLVLRIKGEETPKMPQGANRNLSDEAIERIERWVKAGAILDKGIDPAAMLESYASTPEQLRKAALAKMKPEERDKQTENAGLERWKKASPKVTPQVTAGKNFLLFGTLPKNRADATLKAMEQQLTAMKTLLGAPAVDWGEKASLYVFNDRNSFVEFARTIESREVDEDDQGSANFQVPQPYIAVIDPYRGSEEPAASKRGGRRKDDDTFVADRSLNGLLTEQLAIGTLAKAGKPPKWLSLGLGAFLSSRLDPRSTYFQKLRGTAYDLYEQGWPAKANEALGGETKPEAIRVVGFAVVDWLYNAARPAFGPFVHGMLAGGEKLDDVIGKVLYGSRQDFLTGSGQYIAGRYGKRR